MKKLDVAITWILLPEYNEILLQKKTLDHPNPYLSGVWNPFGGGIEDGESPEEAAVRELYEELGLVTMDITFGHAEKYEVPDFQKGMSYQFVFKKHDRDLSKYSIGEGAGITIFHMSELDGLKINQFDRPGLESILKREGLK